MAGNIQGIGKKRRDDTYNRVLDLFLKGQVIPLGGHYGPTMARLMTSVNQSEVTELILTHPDSGLKLITCGVSKCGGPDVCG